MIEVQNGNEPHTNRLSQEKSPYLLRHAANPVDWYPWGPEAFKKAQEEDKTIFLSIGYSSCHWCHVMERESFEDAEIAELLNDACVSVKVDREEHPDLDALFMDVCHLQNGNGGWPLNLFLTPEAEPFFAATYLPKRTIGRLPGLADIVPRVKWLWAAQKEDVLKGAHSLVDTLRTKSAFASGGYIGAVQAKSVFRELKGTFDAVNGGFGFAPKFPSAPKLLFLLDYARTAADEEKNEALSMVDTTLRKMWSGGIHDHLGGGYARYATDERWIVPHFEKMLYDQATLLWAAASLYEIEPDEFHRSFAEDIVACVLRDFTSPESCFWSAIDAESEGEEGLYYLWTDGEIHRALPQGDAGIFCATYAILPGGNFRHEVSGVQTGQNILYETASAAEIAKRYGLKPAELSKRLENDRRVLLEIRGRRSKPALDDKVLMDWNGLMIGALARAGRVFEKKEWGLSAERAALFLQKILVDPKGNWRRRYRLKEAAIPALPGDYASLMWGVMELHQAAQTEKQRRDWLKYATSLANQMEERYWDEAHGGLFLSAADDPYIFMRRKAAADDAVPSANAMAMNAYIAMGKVSGERKYTGMAKAIAACFARIASVQPLEHLSLIAASAELSGLKSKPAQPISEEEGNDEKDKEEHLKKDLR